MPIADSDDYRPDHPGPRRRTRGGRGRRLRAALELVRVFLFPTAVADSYAGLAAAALSRGLPIEPGRVLPLALVSMLVYASGMAANDVLDAAKDRRSAPGRPIPSGRISRAAAAALAASLAAAALAVGAAIGLGLPVAGLLALALAYDAGGKNLPVAGDALMGLCRAGNFLLGPILLVGSAAAVSDPRLLGGALALGLYVQGVTLVSRFERSDPPARAPGEPASRPAPSGAALFVGRAIGAIPLVDAAIVAAISPPDGPWPRAAAVLVLLFILGCIWRRTWTRRTGELS